MPFFHLDKNGFDIIINVYYFQFDYFCVVIAKENRDLYRIYICEYAVHTYIYIYICVCLLGAADNLVFVKLFREIFRGERGFFF